MEHEYHMVTPTHQLECMNMTSNGALFEMNTSIQFISNVPHPSGMVCGPSFQCGDWRHFFFFFSIVYIFMIIDMVLRFLYCPHCVRPVEFVVQIAVGN